MPSPGGQFFSEADGDIEDYFVSDYQLIDQYIGDQLWTWGRNSYGQLGINNTVNRSTPVTTFAGGNNWKLISNGSNFTLAIKTDGTLWGWGLNDNGQLGTNTSSVRISTPVTTFAGGNNWKSVTCANQHTTAIKTDGTLWVWGLGLNGQLGNNSTAVTTATPVTTFLGGNNWKSAVGGSGHTVAMKTDGTLWTWGDNSSGQLGTNNTIARSTPVTTFAGGTNWQSISCFQSATAAIKTDGTLWSWGVNLFGNLGINNNIARSTPVTTFVGGNNWKSLSIGARDGNYIGAIKTDGTLWTWGQNSYGQLGNNSITTANTPVTTFIGGTNWKQVSSGGSNITAVKTDGTLWTWGRNNLGQLGINNTTNRSTPVTTIAGGTNWKSVVSGNGVTAVTSGLNVDLS